MTPLVESFHRIPTEPKCEKRHAAVKVMRLAAGEEPEGYGDAPAKSQAAAELGRKGGMKSAESVTAAGARRLPKMRRRIIDFEMRR
jgi:hypothetical protein